MNRTGIYLAGAAVAAITALAAIQPANALPIANGSFTIVPAPGGGTVTVNTPFITPGTSSKTEPALVVQAVSGNLTGVISANAPVTLSPNSTLAVPPGIGTPIAVNFTLNVGGLVFSFDTGVTNSRVGLNPGLGTSGSFAEQFEGTLSNGGGIFEAGTPVTLAETCTQSVSDHTPGLISCTNSLTVVGGEQVPEPASLAILGASLLGFGLFRRRRNSA